jgi:ligand-binding sensor domain-containing protein/DNA-binding CsgD family transcriptional regulator
VKALNKIFLLLLMPFFVAGQNTIGLPDVLNYSKSTYNAGTQNWDVKQDKNGIIYYANNEGLLSYDGNYWSLYPIPNKTIVRSVEIDEQGKIYVGGQDEMGYFERNKYGEMIYHSLNALIDKKDQSFGDVWDIATTRNGVYFRTANRIFKIADKYAVSYKAKSEWLFMGNLGDKIYAQDKNLGFMTLENNVWKPSLFTFPKPLSSPITGFYQINQKTTLISTLKDGVFTFSGQNGKSINSTLLNTIQSERIYASYPIEADKFALATLIGGVYILSIDGKLIQHFSKKEGLQNNNILSILYDNQKNIWLGLDNGIDCIQYNSPIKHIVPNDINASGYCAIIHNKNLFIGTSAGLYSSSLNDVSDYSFSIGNFNQVQNTTGQTWSLNEINGNLLLGHHEGAFSIEKNYANPISTLNGYWNFTPLSNVFPSEKVVAGNYKGVSIMRYENGKFISDSNLPGFEETSRYVTIDRSDRIWVSHPYHGIFLLDSDPSKNQKVKTFNRTHGLPSDLNNHIFKIKNKLVVGTEKGVYQFNEQTEKFEPDEFYQKMLGDISIRYLKEDTDGNIWFIHEKELGVIDFSFKTPKLIYLKELNKKMLSGFEFLYPIDTRNILLAGESGFFHINYEKYKNNVAKVPVFIRQVKLINQNEKIIFGGIFKDNAGNKNANITEIENEWKSIHFEFTSPIFGTQANIQYSFRLKGLDNDWSPWNNKTEKDYSALPPGKYYFEVKARNCLNQESEIISYGFHILPPWYKTTWAYILFALIVVFSLASFYYKQKNKLNKQVQLHEIEQNRLLYLHQLEIDKAASELIALRNEKLHSEIDFKNSELATNAMHLVQKGELISKIKTELNQIMKGIDNEKVLTELKKMLKVLGEDDKMDKDWEHFAQHFDKVHSDFVVILKETYPTISPNEIKLCTYLRMNLSTKEIAQLMNISVRGVEIGRYRLRKKLGLSTEVNLFDHLIQMGIKK